MTKKTDPKSTPTLERGSATTSRKATYDIHALQFAFDTVMQLCRQNAHAPDAAAVLIKAAEIFHAAINDADEEMEALRIELETPRSTITNAPRSGFASSEAGANWIRSVTKQARTWNDYVDEHVEEEERLEEEFGACDEGDLGEEK